MKKLIVWIGVLAVLGVGGYFAYDKYGKAEVKPQITEATVTRGAIAETVAATGTLAAVRTIDIGTQVSGTVKKLYADFNDIVHQGQLLAELDPSLLQTQVDMQNANLQRADVDINQRKISMENDMKKLERQRELFAKQLVTREALDTAELQVKLDQANIDSSQASRVQTLASLQQAQKNVEYTKIYAPIDGVITVRITDEGRTVNASTSSPSLYTMATDLTKMLLTASIDEAEVAKVREGQTVTFRVDAYAGAQFFGTVKQVRLNAKNSQNVVTYETVVEVNNPDFRLKPGMTATLNVEVQRADDVIRVPAAALRFRPTAEMFELIKQPLPPEAQPNAGRGAGGSGRRGADAGSQVPGATGATKAPDAKAPATKSPAATPNANAGGNRQRGGDQAAAGATAGRGGNAAGGNGQGGRGGGRNMNLTPDQQKQLDAIRSNQSLTQEQRRAEMAKIFGGNSPFGGGRGGQAGGGRTGGAPGGGRTGGGQTTGGTGMAQRGAETVDQLLPPVQRRELRNQRVWLWVAGPNGTFTLKPVNGLTTGVSDGQFTELIAGEIKESDKVVTNFVIPGAKPATTQQQQGNPFQQQNQGRGGPGGGRGGF